MFRFCLHRVLVAISVVVALLSPVLSVAQSVAQASSAAVPLAVPPGCRVVLYDNFPYGDRQVANVATVVAGAEAYTGNYYASPQRTRGIIIRDFRDALRLGQRPSAELGDVWGILAVNGLQFAATPDGARFWGTANSTTGGGVAALSRNIPNGYNGFLLRYSARPNAIGGVYPIADGRVYSRFSGYTQEGHWVDMMNAFGGSPSPSQRTWMYDATAGQSLGNFELAGVVPLGVFYNASVYYQAQLQTMVVKYNSTVQTFGPMVLDPSRPGSIALQAWLARYGTSIDLTFADARIDWLTTGTVTSVPITNVAFEEGERYGAFSAAATTTRGTSVSYYVVDANGARLQIVSGTDLGALPGLVYPLRVEAVLYRTSLESPVLQTWSVLACVAPEQ